MSLKMVVIPSQRHFSAMMKFLIDLGNAQWIDGSGIDEKQEAFDIYEHLISTTKADDAEIHPSGSLIPNEQPAEPHTYRSFSNGGVLNTPDC